MKKLLILLSLMVMILSLKAQTTDFSIHLDGRNLHLQTQDHPPESAEHAVNYTWKIVFAGDVIDVTTAGRSIHLLLPDEWEYVGVILQTNYFNLVTREKRVYTAKSRVLWKSPIPH